LPLPSCGLLRLVAGADALERRHRNADRAAHTDSRDLPGRAHPVDRLARDVQRLGRFSRRRQQRRRGSRCLVSTHSLCCSATPRATSRRRTRVLKRAAQVALLSSRLELRDIRDVEQFAGRIVERSGLELSYHDREDLLASLIVECWRCAGDYDASRASFSTFATIRLRSAVTAWLRTSNERCGRTGFVGGRTVWRFGDGRVHERPRREFVSLDEGDNEARNAVRRDRLDIALTERNGDREADRDSDLGGLYATRDSEAIRDFYEMGLEPPRRAAR
jgi:hypothetical protein